MFFETLPKRWTPGSGNSGRSEREKWPSAIASRYAYSRVKGALQDESDVSGVGHSRVLGPVLLRSVERVPLP